MRPRPPARSGARPEAGRPKHLTVAPETGVAPRPSRRRGRVSAASVAAAVLALAVGALGPDPVGAEADGPDYFRVIDVAADDVLNIRAEPRAGSEKVGEIPPGADCVRNLGCQGGLSFEEYTTLTEEEKAARLKANPRWCQVEYRGVVGWAAGRYLGEGGCVDK
jgi:hypothetical protein